MAMGMFSQDLADKRALENCTKAANVARACTVVSRGEN
jgi:hypothetical protein